MSPKPQVVNPQPISSLNLDEEAWFSDRNRETKRPLRTSPTMPPAPIGDDLADRWFR
jgi:hypothetical protein